MGVTPSEFDAFFTEQIAKRVPKVPWRKPRVPMESVDYWPMAIIIHKTFGGKPRQLAASSECVNC